MVKLAAPPLPTLSLHPPHAGVIPMLGLSTWPLTGQAAYDVVCTALELGYRHLDTAGRYGNEVEVGAALADSGLRREEVFLTTKLAAPMAPPPGQAIVLPPDGPEDPPLEVLHRSLTSLGVQWLDLWLLQACTDSPAQLATWEQMIQAQQEGLVRAIGVSNATAEQIDYLAETTGIPPAVHQLPWSPYRYQAAALEHARQHKIVLQGYSPFSHGDLQDEQIGLMATRHGVSPAQVVLRWHLDQGVVALPRSIHHDHLVANLDVTAFTLSPTEVATLNALSQMSLPS